MVHFHSCLGKSIYFREREAKYHGEVEAKQQEQLGGGNLWQAVAALIDLNGEGGDSQQVKTVSGSPKSMAEQLATPKKQSDSKSRQSREYLPKPAKRTTDLSRMREVCIYTHTINLSLFLSTKDFTHNCKTSVTEVIFIFISGSHSSSYKHAETLILAENGNVACSRRAMCKPCCRFHNRVQEFEQVWVHRIRRSFKIG